MGVQVGGIAASGPAVVCRHMLAFRPVIGVAVSSGCFGYVPVLLLRLQHAAFSGQSADDRPQAAIVP